uniref:Junctional adhesion molecule 2 n=1 Tax=Sphenodon punctatus TaxID=8508 RepID=A0A8D0HC94_SPHPU
MEGRWGFTVEFLCVTTPSSLLSLCLSLHFVLLLVRCNYGSVPEKTRILIIPPPPFFFFVLFAEAILSCRYSVGKGTTSRLEWKKLGPPRVSFVYFNDKLSDDFKDRADMMDSSIRIRNVTRQDSGKYRCEVSVTTAEGQNLGEVTISLTVLVAPALPLCDVPSSALSGTVVELRCKENQGLPAPQYKWYRNGVALLENAGKGSAKIQNISYTMNKKTGTLLFDPVSKEDTGEYYCQADNGIGRPKKCSAKQMRVGKCQK